MNNKDHILEKAKIILEKEGISLAEENKSPSEILRELILPGLDNSKDTLSAIYFKSKHRSGFLGSIKTKIQSKIINTVINVVEKQSMKQQKFNNLLYKAIENLVIENDNLKKELESVKNRKVSS